MGPGKVLEKRPRFRPVIRSRKVVDDVDVAIVDCGSITELDGVRYFLKRPTIYWQMFSTIPNWIY